jgi:hypothetical protein
MIVSDQLQLSKSDRRLQQDKWLTLFFVLLIIFVLFIIFIIVILLIFILGFNSSFISWRFRSTPIVLLVVLVFVFIIVIVIGSCWSLLWRRWVLLGLVVVLYRNKQYQISSSNLHTLKPQHKQTHNVFRSYTSRSISHPVFPPSIIDRLVILVIVRIPLFSFEVP